MSSHQNIVEEVDNEIQACTGGIPPEYNVERMFRETQDHQRKLFGGGAENVLEQKWLEGLLQRQDEINRKKTDMMEEIEEVEEVVEKVEKVEDVVEKVEEVEDVVEKVEEVEEVVEDGEFNELERDGIFLKR